MKGRRCFSAKSEEPPAFAVAPLGVAG